jgi:hypothetical protein
LIKVAIKHADDEKKVLAERTGGSVLNPQIHATSPAGHARPATT